MIITANTTIEEIAEKGTVLINYLSEKGIRCIICGEPIWGSLEEAAAEKGYNSEQIKDFVAEMNNLISSD